MGKIARPPRFAACPSGASPRLAAFVLTMALTGCSSAPMIATGPPPPNPITSAIPSAIGTPNSITTFGAYEFVSVQGAGLIATYALNSGAQKPKGMAVFDNTLLVKDASAGGAIYRVNLGEL